MPKPEIVRNELRRRITSITLTPSVGEHGPVYEVTGDVELFPAPQKDVEQYNQLELVVLLYTLPISLEIVACRNRQKRASETLEDQRSAYAAQPTASGSLAESASQEFDGKADAIWREVMAMDVQALLDSEIHFCDKLTHLSPRSVTLLLTRMVLHICSSRDLVDSDWRRWLPESQEVFRH